MRTAHSKLFRYCTIACCSIIVANGCMLDRRPIFSPGQVVPGQYCPGDMLTASYDFLGSRTCTPRTAGDCERSAPTMTITSSPVLFPSTTLQSYRNSVSFTASGDRVDVNFFYGTTNVFIPPSSLFLVRDNTASATRIAGTIDTALPHIGNCARGLAAPTYMPVQVPGPPRVSGNMRIVEVVNNNSVPVAFTLSGGATGTPFSSVVEPGHALRTDMLGVPGDVGDSRMISIVPMGLMCGAGGDGTSVPQPAAPPINTLVRMGCR